MSQAKRKTQTTAQRWSAGEHPGGGAMPVTDAQASARQLRERRRERIAVRAYFLAAARGFAPGAEWEDWLLAERQEDDAERPL